MDLINLLIEYKELFSYSPSGILGIITNIISHELKINPTIRLITHKIRSLGEEKRLVVC